MTELPITHAIRKERRIMYEQYFFLAKGMYSPSRSRMKSGLPGWLDSRKKAKEEYILYREMQRYSRRNDV